MGFWVSESFSGNAERKIFTPEVLEFMFFGKWGEKTMLKRNFSKVEFCSERFLDRHESTNITQVRTPNFVIWLERTSHQSWLWRFCTQYSLSLFYHENKIQLFTLLRAGWNLFSSLLWVNFCLSNNLPFLAQNDHELKRRRKESAFIKELWWALSFAQ